MREIRSPLDGIPSPFGRVAAGLRAITGIGAAIWQGYAPTISGVVWYALPGTGAASWQGYAPDIKQALLTGVGAATWTGPAPTVVGLIPDGAIVTRDGSTVVDRSGDYVINVAQS